MTGVQTAQQAELTQAFENNRLVGQATGVLIATYGVDPDTAWGLLRRASQDANVKVPILARAVVMTAARAAGDLGGLDPRAIQIVRSRLLPNLRAPGPGPTGLSRRDRQALGAARDALAAARDENARIRDQAADARDSVGDQTPSAAAADRRSSATDRAAAATDRAIASDDRAAP